MKGYWKVDTEEDYTVPGEYSFNNGRMELRLHGSFDIRDDMEIPVIHGSDFDGNKITLFDSWLVDRNYYRETDDVTYFQDFAVVGEKYTTKDKSFIKKVKIDFGPLEEWLLYDPKDKETSNEYIILKPKNDYTEVVFPEGKFSIHYTDNSERNGTEYYIKWKPCIQIKFENTKSINEVTRFLDILTSFFRLVTNKHFQYNSLELFDLEDIGYDLLIGQVVNDDKNNWSTFGFHYKDLADNLTFSFGEWFEMYDDFYDVTSLYLKEYKFLDKNRFLDLVRAFESLARKQKICNDDHEAKTKEERQRVEDILTWIPTDEDREFIRSKLTQSFEPNLRQKMISVIKEKKEIKLSNKRIKSIVNHIVDQRNLLVHLDIKGNVSSFSNYHGVIYLLEYLIADNLLNLIGIRQIKSKESEYMNKRLDNLIQILN